MLPPPSPLCSVYNHIQRSAVNWFGSVLLARRCTYCALFHTLDFVSTTKVLNTHRVSERITKEKSDDVRSYNIRKVAYVQNSNARHGNSNILVANRESSFLFFFRFCFRFDGTLPFIYFSFQFHKCVNEFDTRLGSLSLFLIRSCLSPLETKKNPCVWQTHASASNTYEWILLFICSLSSTDTLTHSHTHENDFLKHFSFLFFFYSSLVCADLTATPQPPKNDGIHMKMHVRRAAD